MVFIGTFFYATNQQEVAELDRRHGEFTLIVEADNNRGAIDLFKARIEQLRESSEFFQGNCTIYFNQLLEFHNFPRSEAMLLNIRSIAGDPVMPFIGCSIPSGETDNCRIFNWSENMPEIDGQNEVVFMQFDE
ncbi:MAG: hypothetical protein WBG37_05510 [Desulfobacterales bacterium]